MLKITVKVIGKEINSGTKGTFTAFSVLTAEGNWYRTAKADVKELEKVKGEVVTLTVSRKFDKVVSIEGELKSFPTLVIEEINTPTDKELQQYNKRLDEINSATLADVK